MPGVASLDFCCVIQMAGAELGVNNTKASIHPAFYRLSIISAPQPVLSIAADHVRLFMTTVYTIL